jgi:nicotinate-nucleotide adenylyltransferase
MEEAELLQELSRMAPAEIGVMGGTFDPVHLGHTSVARLAQEELGLAGVLFVPARIPSFKRDRKIASPSDRFAMLRLAIECESKATADRGEQCKLPWAACRIELERQGVSYTSDTLEELRSLLPLGVRLNFILGTDALATLPTWHNAAAIARLARIVCVSRAGDDDESALSAVRESDLGFDVVLIKGRVPDISSSQIRRLVAQGKDVSGLVCEQVLAYVRDHGLYLDCACEGKPLEPCGRCG